MAKPISFTSKSDAKEYSKAMQDRGYITALHYDDQKKTWVIYVSEKGEGEIPESLESLVDIEAREAMGEEEITGEKIRQWAREPYRKVLSKSKVVKTTAQIPGRMVVGTGKESGRLATEATKGAITGRAFEDTLGVSSSKVHVKGGMKRAIPMQGGERHGYFARIGEMHPARITKGVGEYMPRVASMPNLPRIVSEAGTPRIANQSKARRIQAAVPTKRFQTPYLRAIEKEKEKEKEKEGNQI